MTETSGICGLVLWLGCASAFAEQPAPYEKAAAAGFEVLVDGHLAGSGFFASVDGLGFTAEHVVGVGAAKKKIEVLNRGFGRLAASLVAIDTGHDLALLQVTLPDGGKAAALPIREELPRVGEQIWLFGTPVFRHGVLLGGRCARPDTVFEWSGDHQRYHEVYHVAAMTPKGTSGGVWIDGAGRAAGVQSGMMVVKDGMQGVAFVNPPRAMARLLADKRSARTPWLGLAGDELWESKERVKEFPEGAEGMVVTVLVEGGPAQRAGIEKGWLITRAGGKKVRYRDEVVTAAWARKPGERLEMEFLRPGNPEPVSKSLELGCQEERRK